MKTTTLVYPDLFRAMSRNLQRFALLLVSLGLLWVALPTAAQDPAADRLYDEAKRLIEQANYEAALEEYRLLAQQFPDDRLAPKALLESAELLLSTGDRLAAQRLVERLLADYARSPEAASAFLVRGRIELDEARTLMALRDAQSTFRRVSILYGPERFPQLEARVEGRLKSSELSILLGEYEIAALDLLTIIEDEPLSRQTGKAHILLASIWLQQGEWLNAAQLLQSLIDFEGELIPQRDRDQARRTLDLIQRRLLHPQAGLPRFARTGRVQIPGLNLREPVGIAASPDNQLVVVDSKLPLVALIDAESNVVARRSLKDVFKPGWTHEGFPFVTTNSGVWQAFSGQQIDFKDPKKSQPIKGVEAAARSALGEWFVVVKSFKSLLRYENPRKGWTNLLSAQKPDLVDVASDPTGRLLALEAKGGRIFRVSLDHQPMGTFVQGDWRRAVALAIDPLGYVFVLDRGERKVRIFDPNGQPFDTLGPLFGDGIELRSPEDLAVDGSGRLWIVDSKLPFLVRAE